VADQKDRHRETERDADDLQRRQAEGPPFVDRKQRHQEMHGSGAIKQDGAGHAVPDLDGERHAGFGGIERDEPQRMIDQMRGDVEKTARGRTPSANSGVSSWRAVRRTILCSSTERDGLTA